ncbi:hypothetical protein VKS41_005024 [Umbelopsis sp. WA50703]
MKEKKKYQPGCNSFFIASQTNERPDEKRQARLKSRHIWAGKNRPKGEKLVASRQHKIRSLFRKAH